MEEMGGPISSTQLAGVFGAERTDKGVLCLPDTKGCGPMYVAVLVKVSSLGKGGAGLGLQMRKLEIASDDDEEEDGEGEGEGGGAEGN